MAVSVATLALAACGAQSVNSAPVRVGKISEAVRVDGLRPYRDDGKGLLKEWTGLSPEYSCSGPSAQEYHDIVSDIAARFNEGYMPWPPYESISQWQEEKDGQRQVKVIVCSSSRVFAFSHNSSAIISSGLARLLKESSERAGDERLFKPALAFVVYHELGHILLGHADDAAVKTGLPESHAREIEADIFAAGALSSSGLGMEGADLVFRVLEETIPGGSIGHPGSQYRSSMVLGFATGR